MCKGAGTLGQLGASEWLGLVGDNDNDFGRTKDGVSLFLSYMV